MTTTFSGLPINGDITMGERAAEQWPEEQFVPILQAVLDDPTIASVTWRQYTPYFNDGDPCVFSGRPGGAMLKGLTEEQLEDLADQFGEWPPYGDLRDLFGYRGHWRNPETNAWEATSYEGPDEARYDRICALFAAIEGGHFDNVLLDKFGDHATIKAVPGDGFYVEFYSHD